LQKKSSFATLNNEPTKPENTHTRKRKSNEQHPKARKQPKTTNHFLGLGNPSKTKIT
jgi:hypothetical protein